MIDFLIIPDVYVCNWAYEPLVYTLNTTLIC